MRLRDLKGSYDAIYSLGDLCLASIQLEKNNLRPFSGPLDWMASYKLSDVNRLLRNRFAHFMDYNNLVVEGYASDQLLLVSEKMYNFISNHDFSTRNNTPTHLATYPEVKSKYDRRVQRFLLKAVTCQRILFIRTEGTFEQAQELETVLSDLVAHHFKILLINHTPVQTIVEDPWPLQHTCAIQMPESAKWEGNDALWTEILHGITLS